jgi:anti-sigma-K factor RskA
VDNERTYSQAEREEIEALASAYVLGALTESEPDFARFQALLEAGDPVLVAALEELFEASVIFADAAPTADAPDHIKAGLLQSVAKAERDGTADRMVTYGSDKAPIPASVSRTIRAKNRLLVGITVGGGLVICALLAMIVSRTAKIERGSDLMKTMLRQTDSLEHTIREYAVNDSLTRCVLSMLQEENARLVTMTTPQEPKHHHLFYSPKQKMVVVMREDMPQLDSMHVYEVWAVVDHKHMPVGSFVVDPKDKEPMYTFSANIASAEAFGISIETKGAEPNPDSPMLFAGEVPRFGRN